MVSKKARLRLRVFHRWAGLIVGVQLWLWVVSGLYFAWMAIDDIRGDSNKKELIAPGMAPSDMFPPAQLDLPGSFSIKVLKLEWTPKAYIYRVESLESEVRSFQAKDGKPLDVLSEKEISAIGLSQVKGSASVQDISLVRASQGEYKGPVPAYRIELDDFLRTRLYLDPWSGRLIVQRNALWRVYDFLWMLHIMDYSQREDFNNPLLRIATVLALILILSGYLLFLLGKMPRRSSKAVASVTRG